MRQINAFVLLNINCVISTQFMKEVSYLLLFLHQTITKACSIGRFIMCKEYG